MADPRYSWLLTLVVCFVVFVGSVKSDSKSTCIHDDIALPIKKGPPSEGGDQKRELPSEPDSHIRIHVHPDESLLNNEDYSYLYMDKTSVLWRAVDTYAKGLLVRPLTEPATIAPSCEPFTSGTNIDQCMNGTLVLECGIFEYPEELAGEEYVCYSEEGPCGFEGDVGEGVEADYIMIVGALDNINCGNTTLAFASACNVEYDYFRPINGYFNLCPRNLGIISELDDILYGVILHEMTHAMGFSRIFFPLHRYGEPSPVVDAIYNGSSIFALSTPLITQEIHDHFNCSTVNYAPLENFGGAGTAGSHWEARMFNHELMQGFVSYDYFVISNFTWNFFHDSNWYNVDYEFANSNALEHYEFTWGKGKGCGIITGDCDDEEVYKYKCADVDTQSCAAERLGMGTCMSSDPFDSCQVVRTASNGGCIFDIHYSNETDDLFYLAQKYGEQSRCFEVWDLEECKYSPGCYGAQIYKYQPTNQFAYQIMGQEGITDGPVWCYEGRHVEVGVDYVLCPPISEIQLHFGVQDIIDVNDYVPPPLCHESCLTCTMPQDNSMCLECSSGYMLFGEAPSSCNGSAEIMDPTEGCGVEPTDPPTPPDTGCTAAFPNGCCTGSNCKTPEGCYCDYGCHDSEDCCSDIEETCPKNPITTTATAKKSSTTKAITSTSSVISEVTTTEVITSTSSVIPEVTTTKAITSTSSVIPEVTTTEVITSTSDVIPEVTTTEVITSTSDVIPEVTTTEEITSTSDIIPEVTTTKAITSTSSVIPEITTTEVITSTSDVIPEVTTTEAITSTSDEIAEVTTTKAITSTSSVIPEITTTEAITSTSDVIPEVTTTEVITSTSDVIPEVTTTEAITSTSSVIPEVTTTEVIISTSDVIPKVTTTEAITSTSDIIPEVTTTEVITSTSDVIPEVTTTEAITSTSSVIPEVTTTEVITSTSAEVTTTEVITSTSDVIPEVTTTEIVPTLTTTSLSTTPFPTATPSPTPMVCQDNEARIGNDDVVEWCHNGTWESICYSSSWDFKNAIVLCNELDMPSSGAYIDWTPASDEAVFSHVQGIDCTGTEDSLSECSYTEQEGVCQSNQVVKAYCIQGLANCEQCDKLVECAVEGIARDTYSEPIGSILACTVQFSDPDLSTSTLDEFSEIKFLTGLSTSLIRQFGLISREQTRAIQQQCNVSGEYPQHGDPIQTLQEMGIETLRILYENADGFASVRDFTHSEIRNSITRGDFLDLFHNESIGCSFQHLLYWLTRVPTLAPAYCRVEEGRTTLIDSLIHCNSPFQRCLDAAESEGYESGNYYPVVGNDNKIEIIQCQ